MGYRRPEDSAEKSRAWRDFTDEQRDLFGKAGLPATLMRDHGLFDYFLMHGEVEDGSGFSTTELNREEWEALDDLVGAYVSRFYALASRSGRDPT